MAIPAHQLLWSPSAATIIRSYYVHTTGAALDEVSRVQFLEGIFLFSLIWSAGCTGDGAGRARFNDFFRVLAAGDAPEGWVQVILEQCAYVLFYILSAHSLTG